MITRAFQGRAIGFILVAFIFIAILSRNSSILPVPYINTRPALSGTPLNARQRMARSEEAWKTSVKLRHQMASAHPSNPQIPLFPAQTLDDFGRYPYTLWDFYPATYTCPHDFQRVGRLGDGGKWVCGMSLYEAKPAVKGTLGVSKESDAKITAQQTIIYSFGINGESSFEAEMLERVPSAEMWGYDFSVDAFGPQIPTAHRPRTHFGKFGLGAKDEHRKSPQFWTLASLMAANNHTYIDILKIDIEGAEYDALDAFMDSCEQAKLKALPVGQVMIELHLSNDAKTNFARFRSWWERLEKLGMRPAWMEVNLMAVTLGKGKTDPRCVEYVWVNGKDPRSMLLHD
ncbi:hypothetical protein K504DRAFT_417100 [Pleomassaria siparia CBS 279.74]|uniref:Methyltransferase domain-containing protein n=1 Tax=Pleomassaria siparia CBS 279.74 TaxID=1314801 RepID=A0A6G1JVJ2_9PLEO|nr:hypothetical protein K504DRAFT_417100 [Pleomassaria siparia CBS 279.74]